MAGQTSADLAFLMAHDSDAFVRWDAGQRLASAVLHDRAAAVRDGTAVPDAPLSPAFVDACRQTLAERSEPGADLSLIAYTLTLPSEGMLADEMEAGTVDPAAIHAARQWARRQLAAELKPEFAAAYAETKSAGPYVYGPAPAGRRRLAAAALAFLNAADSTEAAGLAAAQLAGADNMSDEAAAFNALLDTAAIGAADRQAMIDRFEAKWGHDALVMDSWFGAQAAATRPGALARVKELMMHPQWSLTNPNKMRALIGRFTMGNLAQFHAEDGSGYQFLADIVNELDGHNPQMAARMTTSLRTWRRLEPGRQAKAAAALQAIRDRPGVSKDTFEVASKTLAVVEEAAEVAAEVAVVGE